MVSREKKGQLLKLQANPDICVSSVKGKARSSENMGS
jgi:hypothetical protein